VLTAEDVLAAIRVHADRLHDVVRRLGCDPDTATRVVESSALDLVDAAAREPEAIGDPVGWLFARARRLSRASAGEGHDDLPLGGGILGGDANQLRLAEALESRPERDRAALLLRDSYDLPPSSVATALGVDVTSAMEAIGSARLAFLPALSGQPAPVLPDHVPLGSLARLAEGGHAAAREATTRRHSQSCERCAAVLDAQERARRLLSGLTVVALPDADRERLLARVESRARGVLPSAPPVADEEWEEEPHHRYSRSLMALGLVLAVGIGTGIGALASGNHGSNQVAEQQPLPLVTSAPVIRVGPTTTPGTGSSTSASPRVFLVTPSPTPSPTAAASASPTGSTTAVSFQLDPSSGPADTQITVTGNGWTPGSQVTVRFLDNGNHQAGSTAQVVTDQHGSFVTTITAHDSNNATFGPRTVTADDGTHHAEATFTITPL
jgi:DNA-directed RNA polymerase specialized sigma24 family protein/cytoskeletal protein RodZ